MKEKSFRRLSRRWADYVPIIAAAASFVAMFQGIAEHWGREALFASITLATAAIAGTASLYVARGFKSLSTHKRVFISYSYDQKQLAQSLREELMKRGAVVWLDVNDLQPGSDLNASINSAIESSNSVVAVLSQQIGANIAKELQSAFGRNVPVIAVMPDNAIRPSVLEAAKRILYLDAETSVESIANAALKSY